VTAGGLLFIGATNDHRFRAFDSKTGQELWVEDMPGQAMAVPITYRASDGKQYVAVAAGGPGLLSGVFPRGEAEVNGTIVAFTLPR
jgi:quinoprotein glucose dehydrogenase